MEGQRPGQEVLDARERVNFAQKNGHFDWENLGISSRKIGDLHLEKVGIHLEKIGISPAKLVIEEWFGGMRRAGLVWGDTGI